MKAIIATLAVVAGLLVLPQVAWAIADPTSTTVHSVYCYGAVIEPGDMMCVARYEIVYASLPAENVDAAYIARFEDDAGQSVNAVAPYVYTGTISTTTSPPSRGYGEGLFSFYWSADDMAALNLTFGTVGYSVVLQGNPGVFTQPANTANSFTQGTIDYRAASDVATQLGKDIVTLSRLLESDWVNNSVALIQTINAIPVLTTDGEEYLLSAIPNLNFMAPDIFRSRIFQPSDVERDWSTSTASTHELFWANTDVDSLWTTAGELFSVPPILFRSVLLTILMVVVAFLVLQAVPNRDAGGVVAFVAAIGVVFPLGAILGMTPLAFVFGTALFILLSLAFNYVYVR